MSLKSLDRALRRHRYLELESLSQRISTNNGHLPVAILESLSTWLRQIARRRHRLPLPLLAKLMHECLRHTVADADPLQVRTHIRTAARIANKFMDQITIDKLLAALAQPCSQRGLELQRVAQETRQRLRRQVAAAVNLTAYSEMARRFSEYLSHAMGFRHVPVRFDAKPENVKNLTADIAARSEVRAYTDGSVLHLPPLLAVSGLTNEECDGDAREINSQLNVMFGLAYLTTHELLHMAAGSFQFSFSSRRGARLFRLLRPLRSNYRWRAHTSMSSELRDKLVKEGVKREKLEEAKPHDLVRFYQHFPNQSLIQYLTNGLEDGRIEAIIVRRWPGLHHVHQFVDEYYSQNVCSSTYAFTAPQALINAIAMYAACRKMRVRLTAASKKCFVRATRIIDRQHQLQRQSLYDSLATARKLYLLLEKHFGVSLDSAQLGLVFPEAVNAEEVIVRMWLEKKEEAEEIHDRTGEFATDEKYKVEESGVWLPEWNGHRLQERSVHVTLKPYMATKVSPALPALGLPFPNLNLQRSHVSGGNDRRWKANGPYLAQDRLARFRVHRRAGLLDVPINYDYQRDAVPLRVSLVFDLSISCEAPRTHLNGDTVIARAIQAGVWIAENLEAQGADVHAYGAVDGGPKTCQLFELNKPVSRYIPTLRCVGAGGFRLGAFIRALSQSPAELGLSPFNGRHVIIVLTDGDPGYTSIGGESVYASLHRRNCPNCTSRHRCRVEHARGGIDARSGYEYLYMAKGYDIADIDHAVSETSQLVQVLCFGTKYSSQPRHDSQSHLFWTWVQGTDELTASSQLLAGASLEQNHW